MTRTHIRAPTATSKRIRNLAAVALLAALCACGRDAVEPKLVGTWQGPLRRRRPVPAPLHDLVERPVPDAGAGARARHGGNGSSQSGRRQVAAREAQRRQGRGHVRVSVRRLGAVQVENRDAAVEPRAERRRCCGDSAGGRLRRCRASRFARRERDRCRCATERRASRGRPLRRAAGASGCRRAAGRDRKLLRQRRSSDDDATIGERRGESAAAGIDGAFRRADQQRSARSASRGEATASAHQAAASAHQAAASAGEAADAVKAEADERIGPFRKAGSKIKNFFTGHKSDADDKADSSPAQQNGH